MDAGARGTIRKVRLGRGTEEDVKADWCEEDVEEKERSCDAPHGRRRVDPGVCRGVPGAGAESDGGMVRL